MYGVPEIRKSSDKREHIRRHSIKKTISFLLFLAVMFSLAACGSAAVPGNDSSAPLPEAGTPETSPADRPEGGNTAGPDSGEQKILIAYFSVTNNTENIANHLNGILDADIYEIVPETAYTSDDLNYNDFSSRSSQEMNDPDARPAISGSVENMEQYSVIFLGYPIWWGEAPRIINTFLESYDFSGKTIVPFCTSGSSGIGSSAADLHSLASGAAWQEGIRFSGGASLSTVGSWIEGLDLTQMPEK